MDRFKHLATWWTGTVYHKEQLDEMLASTDIHGFAYILHDKDIAISGELKKPHYHFLIKFRRNLRGSWFKRFWSDEFGKVMPDPVYCPQGAYDYLIHATPTAQKQDKFQYDPVERISTLDNFDADEKEKTEKISSQQIRDLIMKDGVRPSQLLLNYNMTLQQKELADLLFITHLDVKFATTYRDNMEVYFIYGDTRTGKTRYVYDKHGYENVYRAQGYEDNKWFDSYEGQDVLLLDEYSSSFKFDRLLEYLDGHPVVIPCRYKSRRACFTKVYITSNNPLSKQYPNIQTEYPKSWDALMERLTGIIHLGANGAITNEIVPNSKNKANMLVPLSTTAPEYDIF